MSDMINRQAAIEDVKSWVAVDGREKHLQKDVIEWLKEFPSSAQPQRKTGQWQEDPSGYGFWICSACGFVSEASGADLLYNFCPNCGADMRGEQE